MTTSVKITHEGPGHHDVGVEVVQPGGSAREPHRLKMGQSVTHYVYNGQSILVTELPDAPA